MIKVKLKKKKNTKRGQWELGKNEQRLAGAAANTFHGDEGATFYVARVLPN